MVVFHPRPNTQDAYIIKEVYEDNCYRLPDDLTGITVIDIGANVGAFVAACKVRGAKEIFAYEPEKSNYATMIDMIYRNWPDEPGNTIHIVESAVSSFDGITQISEDRFLGDIKLTGGYQCLASTEGALVQMISIRRILQDVFLTKTWIKLDCEGCEHELLSSLTAKSLKSVDRIFGEVHQTDSDGRLSTIVDHVVDKTPTHEDFVADLESMGYSVELQKHPIDPCLALFWAERKA